MPAYSLLALLDTGLMIGAAVFYAWDRRRDYKIKDRVKNLEPSARMDAALNSKLSELRFHMDADKAKIFQFHNGGYFLNGNSIKKMSLTHLQLRSDTMSPNVTYLQSLPTSLFPNMMTRFVTNKGVIVWDAKNAPDAFLRGRHQDEGLERVMLCGIYHDKTEALIGFISLNWMSERSFEIDEPALVEFAKELGRILGR